MRIDASSGRARTKHVVWLALLCSTSIAPSAFAQAPEGIPTAPAATVPASAAPAAQVPQADAAPADTNGDILVTASRRSETTTRLPFNISAYDPAQLQRSNVTSVTGLSAQVPNFVIQDQGARGQAQSIPIIRGLNASGSTGVSARYFQSPVGTYQDNVPLVSALPLMDLERVEVLRGPQGTLYGAGTLAGAVRLIASAPKLGKAEGYLSGTLSDLAHSSAVGYNVEGAINLPLGDTLALRVAAKQEHDAGFIDVRDVFQRERDDYRAGDVVPVDPNNLATSPGKTFSKRDANDADTTSVRGALRWKLTDQFEATATYNYARIKGTGGPIDTATYRGGPWPIDPRVTLPATGEYERSQATLEPYERTTKVASLDGSYELGFATLATTIAFGETEGDSVADGTISLLGSPYGVYYTGSPANPRAVVPVRNTDRDVTNTQELRLVSNPGGAIDYVVGTFLQQQHRSIGVEVYDPGADTYSLAAFGGSTVPMALGGTYIPLFENNLAYQQNTEQRFREYSLFGDVTWHVTDKWDIAGGARVFRQTFEQRLTSRGSFFFLAVDASTKNALTSKILKFNTSYQLDSANRVYATFSQGFRRGGANAFPLDGPVLEPQELLIYRPDRTNNFEVGLKGRVAGIRYALDAYYIDWSNPQIDLLTPYTLTSVVVNGDKASSKGFELEASGSLGLPGLSFNGGVAYSHARLTRDFALPAGNAAGGIVPDAITGRKGDRLPSAPDWTASLTLTYDHNVASGTVTTQIGADYRGSTTASLPQANFVPSTYVAPGYTLFRASIGYRSGPWEAVLFGDNIFDRRAVTTGIPRTADSRALLGGWGDYYYVTRPRQIGIKVTTRW